MLRPLSLLLVLVSYALGDKYPSVSIPPQDRVHNRTGMQCCYASLETLARYHKIESLYDLTAKYKGTSSPTPICNLLRRKGIPHVCRVPSDKRKETLAFLQNACYSGYGALIGINGNHACVLVGLDNDTAKIISNNHPSKETQTLPTSKFLQIFHGWAVVIWKEKTIRPPRSPPIRRPECET